VIAVLAALEEELFARPVKKRWWQKILSAFGL
jgi:hypothetical protein